MTKDRSKAGFIRHRSERAQSDLLDSQDQILGKSLSVVQGREDETGRACSPLRARIEVVLPIACPCSASMQ